MLTAAPGLREIVSHALESVKRSLICKFWKPSQRIVKAYREGAMFGDAQYKTQMCKATGGYEIEQTALLSF